MRRYGLETLTAAARGALFNVTGTGASVFERVDRRAVRLLPARRRTRRARSRRQAAPDSRRRRPRQTSPSARTGRCSPAATPLRRAAPAHAARVVDGGAQLAASGRRACRFARSPSRSAASSRRRCACSIHAEIGSGYTSPQRLPVAYYVVDKNGKNPWTARCPTSGWRPPCPALPPRWRSRAARASIPATTP